MSHIDIGADLEDQQARIDALEAQLKGIFNQEIDHALTQFQRMGEALADAKRWIGDLGADTP